MIGTKRLKGLLPTSVRRKVKRLVGVPETRLNRDWKILESIGPRREKHIVVDVGAHNGWFFHCWLDWCPEAEVHAFEPTTDSFHKTRALYGADPRVCLNQVGVGAIEGELTLNTLDESTVSNSFLHPDMKTWNSIEYRTGAIREERVPVVRLDDYCADHGVEAIYLIKIDVQGYELEVLKGARESLKKTSYIFVESAIQRLYEGAPSFAEVFTELDAQGFHLITMRAWHRGNYRLMETDMLFRRNDLAPDIDRSKDRYYLELR